ncbi:sensor histidine kinase [Planotetraspora kaengkrachanensis]|uniref:Sensor histidine kinase n=1 Tax=Planotetraspora kaengkrachanensis TaxID=575193 RepID=A0A8J3PXJ7_9ACTN|nr:histidine kinase [Planotetraspora kaengkrachanensis]GIG82935.1 hypothetical protein Pka01_60620 [Planotetraspora kaengkrachanensis]
MTSASMSGTRRDEPAGSLSAERIWGVRNLTRSLIMFGGTVWATAYFIVQHPPMWQSVLAVAWATATAVLGMFTGVLAQRGSPSFPRVFPVLVVVTLGLEAWGGWPWAATVTWATTACGWRRAPRSRPRIAALAVAAGLIALAHGLPVAGALALVVFVLLPGIFAMQTRQSADLVRELQETRRELARLAVVEERNRIARDLHDLVGHSLSVVAVKTELARRLVTAAPERAATELDDIESVVRRALAEVRQAVTNYRQPTLAAEIAGAVSAARSAQIQCTIDIPDTWELPAPVEGLLAWTVREGVTNVLRHSGAAHCWISLELAEQVVSVEIRDDGRGPAGGGAGNGITGLSERAAAFGGQIEVGAPAEGGFRIRVRVPLEAS